MIREIKTERFKMKVYRSPYTLEEQHTGSDMSADDSDADSQWSLLKYLCDDPSAVPRTSEYHSYKCSIADFFVLDEWAL